MNILVTGGTGTVGLHVVRELLAREARVRVLTRSADKARNLPSGAEGVTGDLLNPDTIHSVFKGVEGVFLLNALGTTESHAGLMAVNGARIAGVGRLVYLSVHQVEQAPHLPHFGSKLAIEAAIRASEIPYTILRPNNFFQNDYWFKDAILRYGVYPQPIGEVGLSRVDVRDIAEAAAIALTSSGHGGQTYNLVGPEPHSGTSTAAAWSRALGRPVSYAGNDLDAWERQSVQFMPPWLVFDLRLMYAFFQARGLHATAGDLDRQTRMLGHAPRSFDDFAAETARMWMA